MHKISHYVNKIIETYRALPDVKVKESYWGRRHVQLWAVRNGRYNSLYMDYAALTIPQFNYWESSQRVAFIVALGGSAVIGANDTNLNDFLAAIGGPGCEDRRTQRVHRIRRMIKRRLSRVTA
jgi:hypothetical protein